MHRIRGVTSLFRTISFSSQSNQSLALSHTLDDTGPGIATSLSLLIHWSFVSQLRSPCSLPLQGQESLLKNLDRRCVSQENKPRIGRSTPRRLCGYSIFSCVWLRFPLHCVKVVIKKYGLCDSKVFQGPQNMLNILYLVISR